MRSKPLVFDNREAMAYVVFRRFNCSRADAVATVDEMTALVAALGKVAQKPYRRRPRRRGKK